MKAGFIGLGALGTAMAKGMVERGVELVIWNRTKEKMQGVPGESAQSPADVAAKTDVLVINVFDSVAVRDVLAGPEGVLSGDAQGKLIIDTTTNDFRLVGEFHALCAEAGAQYLEAPVMGSVVPALAGKLSVLVSGTAEAFERGRPFLEKIGRKLFHFEEPGNASKLKVINNLVLGAFMATLAETVALGEAAGFDKATVLDVLDAGGGQSLVLNAKKTKLLNEDFSPHFSSAAIHKDLRLVRDLADEIGMPLFTGSMARELFASTFPMGEEGLDFSAIYRVFTKK